MKVDVTLAIEALGDVPAMAREAEALGFDGIWTAETRHDPFLPLALAAEHTRRVSLGTTIAVAFPRSPTGRPDGLGPPGGVARALRPRARHAGEGTQRAALLRQWTAPGPRLREISWPCGGLGRVAEPAGR